MNKGTAGYAEWLKTQIETTTRNLYDLLKEYDDETRRPFDYCCVSPDGARLSVNVSSSPRMENLRYKTNEVPYYVCDKCKQKDCVCAAAEMTGK